MGRCDCNNLKKHCKKDICCLDCKGICKYHNDRCFTQDEYRNRILRGYPDVCKFYKKTIKVGEKL